MEDESQNEQTRENSSYSQATIDEKLEGMAALMDIKFESMLQQIQQLLPNSPPSTSSNPPRNEENTQDPLNTPSRSQIPMSSRPSRQSRQVQHEDANFRHRFTQDTTQSDTPIETTSPVVPFYRRRLSAPTNVDPYRRENTIVRAVADIDPLKSGVLLTSLDLFHVYKWYKDLQKLQKRHPYDKLHYGSFISSTITLRINAFNEAQSYFRRTIMDAMELFLENEELIEIILEMTLPKTEQEWLEDFRRLVQFKKLKGNQHEIPPDTSRFDEWYTGIMEIIYDAKEVFDILSSHPSRQHHPCMRSYSGKAGLMQIFYELIPMGTGKYIHSQISYVHLDHKDLTFEEYTKRFQEQNQKFQDASDAIKHNRAKMSSPDMKTGMTSVNKSFISNNFNNRNQTNARNNNNTDKQLVPYHNPYQGKLNNLTTKSYHNTYNIDKYNDDNDEYNDNNDKYNDDNYDSTDEIYDLDEVFGGRNESIEGLNPGSNLTSTLSSIDRNNTPILPCFAELKGKCLTPQTCKFSHDFKILQKSWKDRQEELNNSKYRPNRNNTPQGGVATPLRSITTEEGQQVSISLDNNSNEINHHFDRNQNVSFADQQARGIPDLSKGGGDRGQRFL
jgi:hypothetical protein